MPDNRVHDVSAMTDSELERARRHLMVSLSRGHRDPYCRPVTGSTHPHRRNTGPSPAMTNPPLCRKASPVNCLQHARR